MKYVNQHSLALFALLILAGVAAFLLRDGFKWRDAFLLAALALLMGGAWLIARPVSSSNENSAAIETRIGAGQPVLLEFQSPY